MEEKRIIPAPEVNQIAMSKVFDKMYITNVEKRLRELNSPSEIDMKRWIWELIQNAKDTIAGDPVRNGINIRILVDGDTVKFMHDGAPFTSEALYGLLYKYSDEKDNQESTGRFGTGFLTTHCLSKIVTVESSIYTDLDHTQTCGFSVTMYRDGLNKEELIEGLNKMRKSEVYYDQPNYWTTFTYNVNSDESKKAIELGIENFNENIAQTMLFCKELKNVELNNNGRITTIIRKPEQSLAENIYLAEFEISGEKPGKRRFIYTHDETHSDELSKRYKADRKIRLDAAIEIDENNQLIEHAGKTSHFCVLPLVGIENQLNEPIIVNCPDFEPDSERQSLILNGRNWNEEKGVLTETGINQLIYNKILPLYERLVSYLSLSNYGKLYYLACGLDRAKSHNNLDKEWYSNNVINNYRDILLKFPIVKSFDGSGLKKLSECIFVRESNIENESKLHSLLSSIYPNFLVLENHEWSSHTWSKGLNIWNTASLCQYIEQQQNWSQLNLTNRSLPDWYNEFLLYIKNYDERLLTEHALLPNMEGQLLKMNHEGFKQGENVTPFIIKLLNELGKNIKQSLLHSEITAVTLNAKYTSQSFSADVNHQAKTIIDNIELKGSEKTAKLLPLYSIVPDDLNRYKPEFIKLRKGLFDVYKSLRPDLNATCVIDNSLLPNAWEEYDLWAVKHILEYFNRKGSLSQLPHNLDAKWLNDALIALQVQPNVLNDYKVLPNQNGVFKYHSELYIDAGIPDVLKSDIFNTVSLCYKNILLHQDIEATSFAIVQRITISDITNTMKTRFAHYSDTSKGNYFRGSYHSYSQEVLDCFARYIVSILPANKESSLGKKQAELYNISKVFLGAEKTNEEKSIAYESIDLWQVANSYVANQIAEKLSSIGSLTKLCEEYNFDEEEAFNHLNIFYSYIFNENISLSIKDIYPNQNGYFCKTEGTFYDKDRIDEILKDVIKCLVPCEQEYRNILRDGRCSIRPTAEKTLEDAYKLIDDQISEFYKKPENWKNPDFIKAVHLLIEEWGESSNQFTDRNFPKTRPVSDSIVLNVVWKKEKRALLMDISTALTEDEIKTIIENKEHVGDLSNLATKVKELEDENELLRSQLEAYGMMPKSNEQLQVETVLADGSRKIITIAEPQYADLSKEEMRDYLIEAKTAVKLYLENKGYEFRQGICEDSWCNIYGVYKDGKEVPMVVHSYKSKRRGFSLNASDWEQLSKENSMLWVMTHDGPQCVPFYALPRDSNTIAITFSPENMQYKSRCIALAEILRYFKGLHFNFGTEIKSNNEPEPFNSSGEDLKRSIENTIRELHDLPAQSSNSPAIGANLESTL